MTIGTPIQGTLWRVQYRYRVEPDANAPKPEPLPTFTPGSPAAMIAAQFKAKFAPPSGDELAQGAIFVITADGTGADLLTVTERAARAMGQRGTEFSLCQVERMSDALHGTALLLGGPS